MQDSLNTMIAYKEGAISPISEVRKLLDGKDIEVVLAFDKRFVCKIVAICKSCRKDHKKGCCDNYARLNRTSTRRIENCLIIPQVSNNPPRSMPSNLEAYLEYKENLTKPFRCGCGSIVQHCGKAPHRKSKKHMEFVKKLDN